jgi:hypothetical protein
MHGARARGFDTQLFNQGVKPCLLFTATKQHFILAGQHTFDACRVIRQRYEAARQEPPAWTMTFRVNQVLPTTPLDIREKIGGQEQQRAATVMAQDFLQTMKRLKKELEDTISDEEPFGNMNKALESTWLKTGKVPSRDGSMVCSYFFSFYFFPYIKHGYVHEKLGTIAYYFFM